MTLRARTTPAELCAWLGPRDRAALAAAALVFAAVGAGLAGPAGALLVGPLAAVTTAIALIDGRRHLIPDLLTVPLIAAGIAAMVLLAPPTPALAPAPLLRCATAAATVLLLLALRAAVGRWTQGQALGLGDIKLIAAAALWLAPGWIAPYVFCASATALIEALIGPPAARRRIAFGRHLAPWLLAFVILQLRFPV